MSNNNTHMDDDLLVKYLAGETAPAETAQVKDWLSAAEDNRLYFEQFKKIWDGSLDVAGKPRADEDAAFTRLQNRIKSTPPATQPQAVVKPMRRYNWLVAAAVAAVFTAVGYFASNYLGRVTLVNLQSNNSVRIDTLPDGSVVTLNAASKLSYTDKFNGDTRPVTLLGEAFFKITPNKAKPFIINVNGVTVKVVGTSFNVKSRNGKTEVIVETGIVNVSRDKNNINLKPGEKTVVLKSTGNFSKENVKGKLYSYYINEELVCDNTPLVELVAALNEIYQAHIVIAKPSFNNLPITTVFKDQSLEQVLAVVTGTFPIKAVHKGDSIILQ